jgi:PKD repeat protein
VILAPAGSPTAAFTMSPTPVVVDIPVTFDASTSQVGTGATSITSYAWTFGDGSSGTGRTVAHTFSAAATFNVTVTVTNDRGLSASSTLPVTVGAGASGGGPGGSTTPTAAFTYSPSSPGVGATVFFSASTSSPGTGHTIASYAWTFGDGTSGSGVSPTKIYTAAGSYGVQLTVTDDAGQATTSAPTAVSVGGSSNDPSSNFTYSPTSPGRNDQVVFDASSSTTAQGQTIVDVAWNFGDGTTVVHCPLDGPAFCSGPNSRITPHTFTTAQNFTVNLVVTDSAGRTGAHNTTVSVALAQPTVQITTSPSSPAVLQPVNFNSNNTTYYPGSTAGSFAWSFGDGAVSALANPTHAYAAVGSYSVGLSVTDNKGRTGTANATVTVAAATPPTARFSFGPPSPQAGVTSVLFDGTASTGSNLTYSWNFGDGIIMSSGGVRTITHTYAAAGAYSATLTVTDSVTLLNNTSAPQTVTVVP